MNRFLKLTLVIMISILTIVYIGCADENGENFSSGEPNGENLSNSNQLSGKYYTVSADGKSVSSIEASYFEFRGDRFTFWLKDDYSSEYLEVTGTYTIENNFINLVADSEELSISDKLSYKVNADYTQIVIEEANIIFEKINDNTYNTETISLNDLQFLTYEQEICLWTNDIGYQELYNTGGRLLLIDSSIYNNSEQDVNLKYVKIAFWVWDKDYEPISGVPNEEKYQNNVQYTDISIKANQEFKLDFNYMKKNPTIRDTLDWTGNNVKQMSDFGVGIGIITSYADYQGNTWENPYYEALRVAFKNGVSFDYDMLITVPLIN